MEIREAVAEDVEAIVDLFGAVAEEKLWIGTEPGFDRDDRRTKVLECIERPDYLALVAYDSHVVGALWIFHHDELGPMLGMMIDACYRGRGIGRALLRRSYAWAQQRRMSAIQLLVFPHNTRAIALYRSEGFIEIERYKEDVIRADGNVWDTILMRKALLGGLS
jgi:[ribosomal protein S18]-alanine N-acetyltransferase